MIWFRLNRKYDFWDLAGNFQSNQSLGKTKTGYIQFKNQMEEIVKMITLYLARFVEVGAAMIIGFASIKALLLYLRDLFILRETLLPRIEIRQNLGRSLALALEFLLGADILQTAVAPTWDDIGKLAAIAVLRTGLNYFLAVELKESKPESEIANKELPVLPK